MHCSQCSVVLAARRCARATIQLRAGTSKSDLKIIGGAKNASSTTTIRPEQIRVRYLLIWFTALPPDSDGTYRAAVYNVALQGQP